MELLKGSMVICLCLGIVQGAPQNLIRLVPASGVRVLPSQVSESTVVQTSPQDSPVIARFVPGRNLITRVDQNTPLVARLIQTAPPTSQIQIQEASAPVIEEVVDPNPQYNFGYSVADSITGDSKAREEKRDGDVVTGSYTVADPDGRIRRVTYTADAIHGFQAKVTYDGEEGPVAIPVKTPASNVEDSDPVITSARQTPKQPTVITTTRNKSSTLDQPTTIIGEQPRVVTSVPQIINQPLTTATLIRTVDGRHVATAPNQPTLISIDDTNQAFQITPFGLRALPLTTRLVHV